MTNLPPLPNLPPLDVTPALPATVGPGATGSKDAALNEDESGFILDTTLSKKHRSDVTILAFIDNFIKCKHIGEASAATGISSSLGYMIRHRKDVSNCIQKLIDKSVIKYGFDASEIVERTKEIVDFDPISMQNADGTFKDNLHDIDPAARRNLKKLKVYNLYNQKEDRNGFKDKIVIGKVIEYEFYDKLKAIDLVGKEKDLFKTKTVVEHTITKDMASILLESANRGAQASLVYAPKTVEVESEVIDATDT